MSPGMSPHNASLVEIQSVEGNAGCPCIQLHTSGVGLVYGISFAQDKVSEGQLTPTAYT